MTATDEYTRLPAAAFRAGVLPAEASTTTARNARVVIIVPAHNEAV